MSFVVAATPGFAQNPADLRAANGPRSRRLAALALLYAYMTLLPVAVLAMALCAPAFAAGDWFTVVGTRDDAASDTVEVDPVPKSVNGDSRVMAIQVNRASPRQNWDGVPFRSYQATVEFDCAKNTAFFQQVSYFLQPYWAGPSHKSVTFSANNRRPMRFRDMTPNPMERILKAACAGYRAS